MQCQGDAGAEPEEQSPEGPRMLLSLSPVAPEGLVLGPVTKTPSSAPSASPGALRHPGGVCAPLPASSDK